MIGGRPGLWLAIGLTVFIAFAFRLWGLGSSSITHPEIYAPGITLPEFVTQPIARTSVSTIVRSTLLTDNHPPGYYLLALPWSQVFGTGLTALRMPAALIGALTTLLLLLAYWKREGRFVAMVAATWLALHGTHVLWSRNARMWALSAAMAVVSVWALQELRNRYRFGWALAYVGSLTVGLWTEYTFWPVLAAQLLSEVIHSARSEQPSPVVGLQGLAISLGSPVFVFLLSRLGSSAYLEAPAGHHLEAFAAFGSWFDMDQVATWGVRGLALRLLLVSGGALLMGLGAWRGPALSDAGSPARTRSNRIELILWLSLFWPALLIWIWREQPFDEAYPVRTVTLAIPVVVAAGYSVFTRGWPVLRGLLGRLAGLFPFRQLGADVVVAVAVVPFVLLLAVSPVMPAVAPRSMLVLVPFQLVLAARGLAALARGPAARAVAVAGIVLIGAASSILAMNAPTPRDYQGLAAAITQQKTSSDLFVVEDQWYATPVLYYLGADVIESREARVLSDPSELDRISAARIWLLKFDGLPDNQGALLEQQRYRAIRSFSVRGAEARLFERSAP